MPFLCMCTVIQTSSFTHTHTHTFFPPLSALGEVQVTNVQQCMYDSCRPGEHQREDAQDRVEGE